MSATRTALVTAVSARVQTLGHLMTADEIEAIVNDVEAVINSNAGTVVADAAADIVLFPADPQLPQD